MRSYVVMERPGPEGEPDTEIVKDGLCWPALLLAPLWAIAAGEWLLLLAWAAASLAVAGGELLGLSPLLTAAMQLGVNVLLALEANDWRVRRLCRAGYAEAGLLRAANMAEAEARWFLELRPAAAAPAPTRPAVRGWRSYPEPLVPDAP